MDMKFSDIREVPKNNEFSESPLGRKLENQNIPSIEDVDQPFEPYVPKENERGVSTIPNERPTTVVDVDSIKENEPIQNKRDGMAREREVYDELKEQYPEDEGYTILSEVYLRDKDGNIVKDPETGEARRIDFVVVKDGKVVDSVEVTSKTADKTEQSAKEKRIRDEGGNYVKDENGNLVEIPSDVQTRIERRD